MDLLRIYIDGGLLRVELSLVVTGLLVVLAVAAVCLQRRTAMLHRFRAVEVEIALGEIGRVKLQPNARDIQIAYKIWVELMTRKAAQPLDEENDVILEIYESWHKLFQNVRALLGEIPAELLRTESSTREIVRIATETLNRGLRPHLTRWQAHLRAWDTQHPPRATEPRTPQERQREFPRYDELMTELKAVNQQLRLYADALQGIVEGK